MPSVFTPAQSDLKNLLFNSVSLNDRLSGEALEILYERVIALPEDKKAEVLKVLQNEQMAIQGLALERSRIIEQYLTELKSVKISANQLIRKTAETETKTTEGNYLESLLQDLDKS